MKQKFIKSLFLASLVAVFFVITSYVAENEANALPPFARKYKTSCSMCHSIYPKLNAFGQAFKRNGYIWPGGAGEDNAAREQVKMADGLGKGTIDQGAPWGALGEFEVKYSPDLAYRGASNNGGDPSFTLAAPVVEIFTGGSSGGHGWLAIMIAKTDTQVMEAAQIQFNDIVGPDNILNIKVGALLGTAIATDPKFMRGFLPTKSKVVNGGHNVQVIAQAVDVSGVAAGIEINGVIANMVYYGVGFLNGFGLGSADADNNEQKDLYGFLEFKVGGMKMIGDAVGTKWYEDNGATIRLFFARMMQSTQANPVAATPTYDVTPNANVFGVTINGGFSMLQFGVLFQYAMESNGQTEALILQEDQIMSVAVNLGAILMDGKFNPGIRWEMVKYSGDAYDALTAAAVDDDQITEGENWLHVGFSSLQSANIVHHVGVRLKLHTDWGKIGAGYTAGGNGPKGLTGGSMLDIVEYKLVWAF